MSDALALRRDEGGCFVCEFGCVDVVVGGFVV